MAVKPTTTTKLQGKSSFCMGAPPVFGKLVIAGFGVLAILVRIGAIVKTKIRRYKRREDDVLLAPGQRRPDRQWYSHATSLVQFAP